MVTAYLLNDPPVHALGTKNLGVGHGTRSWGGGGGRAVGGWGHGLVWGLDSGGEEGAGD